jgi:hypothetical protein
MMPPVLFEIYDAFRAIPGLSDEQARKAAAALSAHEPRFARIEADLLVLKWMVGTNVALTIAIVVKLYVS